MFKLKNMATAIILTMSFVLARPCFAEDYHMKTAKIIDGEVVFESLADFDEVLKVGFFRIERPKDINIDLSRKFAREFNQNPKYTGFGSQGPVNGYIKAELAQSIRFTMERDHWDKKGWGTEVEKENPNYSPEIQKIGHQLKDVGVSVLKGILKKFDLPEDLWFQASSGTTHDEGSYYLNFNYYDPKDGGNKDFGLGAHTDWGLITVLDVIEPGLEAEINGEWRPLYLEDGCLVINFGEPLQKLLPGVKACNHRVVTQTENIRTSTVMFIDPRVGPYRASTGRTDEGMVYDWDPVKRTLINGEKTTDYFGRLSQDLYGKKVNADD